MLTNPSLIGPAFTARRSDTRLAGRGFGRMKYVSPFGSVAVSTAATRYSTPTVAIRTGAPARLTRMGPSRANPTAIEPLRVIMNSVFAWRSWSRFTSWGIIAASAGAKNVVTVETTMFSR